MHGPCVIRHAHDLDSDSGTTTTLGTPHNTIRATAHDLAELIHRFYVLGILAWPLVVEVWIGIWIQTSLTRSSAMRVSRLVCVVELYFALVELYFNKMLVESLKKNRCASNR